MSKLSPGKFTITLLFSTLVLLAAVFRPVQVTTEKGNTTLFLWAWQKGEIHFINSITGHPVVIRFAMPWRFSAFFAQTDPGTEEYYTSGLYRWNDQLAKEKTRTINYCSEVGVTIKFDDRIIRTKGGCIDATLLWPPS